MDNLTHAQEVACDAWQLISNHPELHEQKTWRSAITAPTRCGTKLCWGGHVVALDDGVFITQNSNSVYFDHVLARPTDNQSFVLKVALGNSSRDDEKISLISIRDRLKSLFGVDGEKLDKMTVGTLSVDAIRRGIIEVLGVDPRTRKLVQKDEPVRRISCYCGDSNCKYNN